MKPTPEWIKTIANDALITRTEFAQWLRVSAPTFKKWLDAGSLPPPLPIMKSPGALGAGHKPNVHGNPRSHLGNPTAERWRVRDVRRWLATRAPETGEVTPA